MPTDSVDDNSYSPDWRQSLASSSSNPDNACASSQPASENRRSGKKLVLGFVVLIVVCGVALMYTLWSYEQLEHARQRTAENWRQVADGLNARYQSLENSLSEPSADESSDADTVLEASVDRSWLQQFSELRADFVTTSRIESQVTLARRLEIMLAEADAALSPSELRQQIEQYNQSREKQLRMLESSGGQILDWFLQIPVPERFSIE